MRGDAENTGLWGRWRFSRSPHRNGASRQLHQAELSRVVVLPRMLVIHGTGEARRERIPGLLKSSLSD
jgi:hypothetical protein